MIVEEDEVLQTNVKEERDQKIKSFKQNNELENVHIKLKNSMN
jgi:hypothetical protein